jgi:hypothetical protein
LALSVLAGFSQNGLKTDALQHAHDTALNIDNPFWRTRACLFLASRLEPSQRGEYIEEAARCVGDIPTFRLRVEALAALYPAVDETRRIKIYAEVREMLPQIPSGFALIGAISYTRGFWDDDLRREAWRLIQTVENPVYRLRGMRLFLPEIDAATLRDMRVLLVESLMALKHSFREELLTFCETSPVFFAPPFLDQNIANHIVADIIDICANWRFE